MGRECVCSPTMKPREMTRCSDCKPLAERLDKLEEQLADALARIAELEQENAQLRDQLAKARKNSSTSSKPPSSDIVKPKKKLPKGAGRNASGAGSRGTSGTCGPVFRPRLSTSSLRTLSTVVPIAVTRFCPAARRRRESSSRSKSKKHRHTSKNTRDWPIGVLIVGKFTTRRSRRRWSRRASWGRD